MNSTIDLNQFITRYPDGTISADGAVDKFEAHLEAFVESLRKAEAAKADRNKNRSKAVHAVFDKAKTNRILKPRLVQYAMQELNVPLDEADAEEAAIIDFLDTNRNKEFGILLGPQGGVIRCKLPNGTPTQEFLKDQANIKFGKIVRKKKGDLLPEPSNDSMEDEEAPESTNMVKETYVEHEEPMVPVVSAGKRKR